MFFISIQIFYNFDNLDSVYCILYCNNQSTSTHTALADHGVLESFLLVRSLVQVAQCLADYPRGSGLRRGSLQLIVHSVPVEQIASSSLKWFFEFCFKMWSTKCDSE